MGPPNGKGDKLKYQRHLGTSEDGAELWEWCTVERDPDLWEIGFSKFAAVLDMFRKDYEMRKRCE
jgi:hypothetical protein